MGSIAVSSLPVPVYCIKRSSYLPKPPKELAALPISLRTFVGIAVFKQPFSKFHPVFHWSLVVFYLKEGDKQESVVTVVLQIHRILTFVVEESRHTLSGTLEHLHILRIFCDTRTHCRNNVFRVVFGCLFPHRCL